MIIYSRTVFSNRIFRQPATIYRYIRNISRRGDTKLLKGTVKAVDGFHNNDFTEVSNYQDFIKTVKSNMNCNELEIEKALTSEDDFGSALQNIRNLDDDDERMDKDYIAFIKKKIIGKKYFKMDLETNLLTHAAKEQIRYLHRRNPEEWTLERLSQSFPITVNGAKKLLKSNYVLKAPEKITQHDKEVHERWKALESGEASELISPYTQRMWDEGKIMKQNYKSNPNLPTPSPDNAKTVLVENKIVSGEYSTIIKQYVNYKKEKESSHIKPSAVNELSVSDGRMTAFKSKKNENEFRFNKFRYHVDDETNDSICNSHSSDSKNSKHTDGTDVLHSQFKINLKNEKNSKEFTSTPQNLKWIENQGTIKKHTISSRTLNPEEIFTKIAKYQKESVELKKEASKSFHLYNENRGYQHIKGKIIKNKINLPANSNKNTLYKVGQCVYDKNGEFLYKIPLKK